MTLTERDAQRVVMNGRYRRGFVLPNYTPRGWWECDVFEVTAAGYFREYEVKLTLSDFKHDAKKRGSRYVYGRGLVPIATKHQLLAEGNVRGPGRFYFVTPPGLLFTAPGERTNPAALVPIWAGLIEITDVRGWLRPVIKVPAPRLHGLKFEEKRLAHAQSIVYYRFHNKVQSGSFIRTKEADELRRRDG